MEDFITSKDPIDIVYLFREGRYKLIQIGTSCAYEYLKRVGIDTCTPHLQIRRMIGKERLGIVEKETATQLQCYTVMKELSKITHISENNINCILWQFCIYHGANICSNIPRCEYCKMSKNCNFRGEMLKLEK